MMIFFTLYKNRIIAVHNSSYIYDLACLTGCTAIVDTTVSMILMPPEQFELVRQHIHPAGLIDGNTVRSVLAIPTDECLLCMCNYSFYFSCLLIATQSILCQHFAS